VSATQEPVVRELIVTGPTRERLFELFSRVYAGRHDVRVVMDRRREPRRRWAETEDSERRRAERRRESPAWVFPPSD
jgi:hypothetical protein